MRGRNEISPNPVEKGNLSSKQLRSVYRNSGHTRSPPWIYMKLLNPMASATTAKRRPITVLSILSAARGARRAPK